MNIQNLLGQFLGGNANTAPDQQVANAAPTQGTSGSKIPGGLMGGAAAGGVVALLLGSKKARKFAGKAAGYGGAAVVGGLAFSALQNWRKAPDSVQPEMQAQPQPQWQPQPQVQVEQPVAVDAQWPPAPAPVDGSFEMKLVTAMIAAAKADGHIDSVEQDRIFAAIEQMQLSPDLKALVLDLLRQPLSVDDVARGVEGLEQKAELYTASCLAIDEDDPRERAYLDQLSQALNLPGGLAAQIRQQTQQGMVLENDAPPSLPANPAALRLV